MTREVDCIIGCASEAKISGLYPGYTTNGSHAQGSYHERRGTPSPSGGVGLAVDFDAPGNNPAKLLACAKKFAAVGGRLFELFHTPLGFSYKAGRKVPWTIADHVTHVHVAVPFGTFLTGDKASAPTPLPSFRPVPATYGQIIQHGVKMQSQHIETASLDDQGRGYIDTHIPFDKLVSIVPLGPSPDRDGYGWPNWYWSANNTDGQARIEIESGEPHKPVGFIAWRVD